MPPMTHLVQDLNNILQQRGQVNHLSWSCRSHGPQKALEWVAVAYLQGIEYGRGSAHTKRLAKEIAAARTIHALITADMEAAAAVKDFLEEGEPPEDEEGEDIEEENKS